MNTLGLYLCVAGAGAVGAPARYLLDGVVQARWRSAFPLGTLVINVTGSFLLGVITGLALYHALPDVPRVLLATGFCGAYTTFSTFAFETARLAEVGEWRRSGLNVAVSVIGALVAAACGLALAGLF